VCIAFDPAGQSSQAGRLPASHRANPTETRRQARQFGFRPQQKELPVSITPRHPPTGGRAGFHPARTIGPCYVMGGTAGDIVAILWAITIRGAQPARLGENINKPRSMVLQNDSRGAIYQSVFRHPRRHHQTREPGSGRRPRPSSTTLAPPPDAGVISAWSVRPSRPSSRGYSSASLPQGLLSLPGTARLRGVVKKGRR